MLSLTAHAHLQGAPADGPADHLLELGLQQVIGLRGADRDLQVTVVQGSQLDGQAEGVTLEVRLAIAGHAQQHAYLGRK